MVVNIHQVGIYIYICIRYIMYYYIHNNKTPTAPSVTLFSCRVGVAISYYCECWNSVVVLLVLWQRRGWSSVHWWWWGCWWAVPSWAYWVKLLMSWAPSRSIPTNKDLRLNWSWFNTLPILPWVLTSHLFTSLSGTDRETQRERDRERALTNAPFEPHSFTLWTLNFLSEALKLHSWEKN